MLKKGALRVSVLTRTTFVSPPSLEHLHIKQLDGTMARLNQPVIQLSTNQA